MAQQVRDMMTQNPVKLSSSSSMIEAAQMMQQHNVGAIILEEGGRICGIVTDRDLVVRGLAAGHDPHSTTLAELCTQQLITLSPNDNLERAIELMRNAAIRRVPVVEAQGQAVGILSLGDLAKERDSKSVLGQISAAPPNN
jgi:CBS domain-containing protein